MLSLIQEASHSAIISRKRIKILVVNHGKGQLSKAHAYFNHEQFEIRLVHNFAKARELLKRHNFDAVVSDYHLDGLWTGLDLWYLANHYQPWTHFLIVSEMPDSQYLNIVGELSYPPAHLRSPFNKDELESYLMLMTPELLV